MKKFSEQYLHEILDILQDAVNRGRDPLSGKLDSPETIHENFAYCVEKLKTDPYFFHKINKIPYDSDTSKSLTVTFKDKVIKGKYWHHDTNQSMDSHFSFLEALKGNVKSVRIHEVMQEALDQIYVQVDGATWQEVVKERD